MKVQSSDDVLNKWRGDSVTQERWERACDKLLQQLVRRAVGMSPEALDAAELKLTARRRDGRAVIMLTTEGEPQTVVRLITEQNRPPVTDLGTLVQKGVGTPPPQLLYSSESGLSGRSTRATVSRLIEDLAKRLGSGDSK